ncbi:hypothetical protein QFZ66_001719 [Streptomyces sp. B4I13]|nr:hypothetical protein [Streptomyces sp. B4I13]
MKGANSPVKGVAEMATQPSRIEQHPDLMALRSRYAQASSKPTAQATEGLTLLTGLGP